MPGIPGLIPARLNNYFHVLLLEVQLYAMLPDIRLAGWMHLMHIAYLRYFSLRS